MYLRTLYFVLTHYAVLAGFALLSYLLGRRLTVRVAFHSLSERIVFCTALGLGAIAELVFGAALLRRLYPGLVLVLLLMITVLCAPALKELLRELKQAWIGVRGRSLGLALVGIGVLPFVAPSLLALYPPTAWDATMSHLALARSYVESHALLFSSDIRGRSFPQLNQMLFTFMLLLHDDVGAQLIQFLMLVLVAGGIYAWGRRLFNWRVGVWGAALWISSPLVIFLGSSAYVDAGLTLFVLLGVYAFANLCSSGERHWAVLSGVMLGCAAATKYTGLLPLAVIGVGVFVLGARQRRFSNVILFAMAAALIAIPWYARTYYYTGNPVSPFLPEIFGPGTRSLEEVRRLLEDMRTAYGTPRDVRNLLLLPWNLTFHNDWYHGEGRIGIVYLVALPTLVFGTARDPRIASLEAFVLLSLLLWFFSFQLLRFLVPTLPFLSLALAASLGIMTGRFVHILRPQFRVIFTIAMALALSSHGLHSVVVRVRRNGVLPVSVEQRAQFLARLVPYSAIDFLNETRGRDYAVYGLFAENMKYFAKGTLIGDWFGPGAYDDVLKAPRSGERLYRKLRSLGVEYLLVNKQRYRFYRLAFNLPQDQRFQRHFRLIYAEPYVELFELRNEGPHDRRVLSPEMLRNPGFERLQDGKPVGWWMIAHAHATLAKSLPDRGIVVRGDHGNFYFQEARALSGRFYLLSALVRAEGDQAVGRLHLEWRDRQNRLIRVDIETVPAGTAWQRDSMIVKAPDGTWTVRVVADAQGSAWYDDFSLREVAYISIR